MNQILIYASIGLFLIFGLLSIAKSINYGFSTHNLWRGILLFLLLGIIAFGILNSLFAGNLIVYGFIHASGDISLLPYLYFLIISSFIYWYGILGFHQKLVNRILGLGGFIFFNIAFYIFLLGHMTEGLVSLVGLIVILIWVAMIYAIVRIWNLDPAILHTKKELEK